MTLIAKNIRWFRKQQQISQTEFASIFGITRASVGAYEEGRAEPKLELLSRFAKYYNVDLSSFIDKDMSLLNGGLSSDKSGSSKENEHQHQSSSSSTFIQEILETPTPKKKIEHSKLKRKDNSSRSLENPISFYRSAQEIKELNKSEWPFFAGCDAVFECSPHIERDTSKFRDGLFFICVQVTQPGLYKGVFIEQNGNRLSLLEHEVEFIEGEKKLWRVLYTVDSINTILNS